MITNSGVSTEIAKGSVVVFDAVTLTVKRGRIIRFPGGIGVGGILTPITDTVRWTSAPVPLRVYAPDGSGPTLFQSLPGVAYSRDKLVQKAGREVTQISLAVAGSLPISLATACDNSGNLSGSFMTSLMELCLLGLLDGAHVTIDQIVLPSGQLPSTPTAAGSAYGIVSTIPVRRFAGIVRQAKPGMESVTLDCCDPMILGGGSVPVGIFSPECRWDFCDGRCPVDWNLQSAGFYNHGSGTHQAIDGTQVLFGDFAYGNLQMPNTVAMSANWGFLVPQDGPMMGMRFQIGGINAIGAYTWGDFADYLPWTWSCSIVHIEYQCSKLLRNPELSAGVRPRPCSDWDSSMSRAGMPSSLNRFGGFPDMPQPESA